MTEPNERRRAARYHHRAHGTLLINNNAYPVHVINISSCGALIAIVEEHTIVENDEMTIDIESEAGQFSMRGKVAHVKNHYIGLECYPPNEDEKANMQRVIEAINEKVLD